MSHKNSIILPPIKSALTDTRSLAVLDEADETVHTLKKRKKNFDVDISNTPMKKKRELVFQELD